MANICLIVPYLGKIPPAFNLFLKGAEQNPSIKVHWLTDQETESLKLPPNIIVHKTTLDQFRDQAQEKLGLPISIDHPYKLCDFRPALSVIYPELVEGYDFWGFGDFDVVWGDLETPIAARIEGGYDLITFHNLWISGAFTIMRNAHQMNNAFRRHSGWREVFGSPEHYAFDECDRNYELHMSSGDIGSVNASPPSLTQIFFEMDRCGEIKASFGAASGLIKEWIGPSEIIEVDHRNKTVRSLDNEMEFPLFHWVLKGGWPAFELPKKEFPDVYYISREGFWERRSQITILSIWTRRLKGEISRIAKGIKRRLRIS